MTWRVVFLGIAVVCAAGCATTGKSTSTESEDLLGAPVEYAFRPARYVGNLVHDSGRYPSLFAPSSYAVLLTPDVLNMKIADAEAKAEVSPGFHMTADQYDEHFWVIELHLESMFADSSIAYDVVGLRNMQVALVAPDGRDLSPLQRVLGSNASEEPVGALRKFGRTNLLVFPKRDIISGAALLGADAPALKLRIDGFHSTFSVEWAALPPDAPAPQATEQDTAQVIQNNLVEFYQDLRIMMKNAH